MAPMANILDTALAWMAAGRKVAMATVIATWGSSPRPVGSQLVVDAGGAFEGSVSGGCIEGAVITEALAALADGKPRRLVFGVSNDRAWEVGLACGGEIEVFVEAAAPHRALFKTLAEVAAAKKAVCVLTELDSGEKTLLRSVAETRRLPPALAAAAREAFSRECGRVLQTGGKSFFLQGWHPDFELIIIGAVHISQLLALMARAAGYAVTVVDPRGAFATAARFPNVALVPEWPDDALEKRPLHPRCAVVALTHDPKLDDPALAAALKSAAFYIGALGSDATHARRRERLDRLGFSQTALDRIHGPVGLAIGARTPAEIAIAIMAEITRTRRMAAGDASPGAPLRVQARHPNG